MTADIQQDARSSAVIDRRYSWLLLMNGVFVIDKPEGMTSREVVNDVGRRFGVAKAGHLGTLDPMATGVLPVCVGKATRLGQFIPSAPKEYTGTIRFGFSTSTYDREGTRTGDERPPEMS